MVVWQYIKASFPICFCSCIQKLPPRGNTTLVACPSCRWGGNTNTDSNTNGYHDITSTPVRMPLFKVLGNWCWLVATHVALLFFSSAPLPLYHSDAGVGSNLNISNLPNISAYEQLYIRMPLMLEYLRSSKLGISKFECLCTNTVRQKQTNSDKCIVEKLAHAENEF